MKIEQILKEVGLSNKEKAVFIALLRLGFTNASKLSTFTKLPRQTVYSILDRLVDLGLVEQSDKRGVKQYYSDPNRLSSYLEKRRKGLEISQKLLEEEMPTLLSWQANVNFPEIKYYEGKDGLKNLFENILHQYKKTKNDNRFRGYGVNNLKEALGDYLYGFVEKRNKLGVVTNLIIANTPDDFGIKDEKDKLGRTIKKIAMEPQKAGLYIAGNAVYLFSFEDKVGVMIEDKAIADLLKNTFDDHWRRIN